MNDPQELRIRTLPGYGSNGLAISFPNGTILSIKTLLDGSPDLLVEGPANITKVKSPMDSTRLP
jgi:hypothetical protein